ncbi:MAG TPA: TlpA disulfide reductase family protein [Phycisphaerae bacterium]|nr:TlpA disulfide reductase family protein [Phycisphaerae bacterium]
MNRTSEHAMRRVYLSVALLVVAAGVLPAVGCDQTAQAPRPATEAPAAAETQAPPQAQAAEPRPAEPSVTGASAKDIPRFAAGSPFATDYKPPVVKEGKRLWARSCLWAEAPKLVVEKWLSEKPETRGKYVLVEFWATWCSPSRRSIALLNRFHEKFGKELAVIAVSDETEAAVRRLKDPQAACYSAIDTQGRMKDELGVFGIPHVIIIEPGGFVVWEGFPLLPGHELTDEKIEKILAVGRKKK